MSAARYFVFNRGTIWLVTLDGRPVGRQETYAAALQSAIVMADLMGSMKYEADVMVEQSGSLQIVWSHGVDPLPELRTAA